MTWFAKLTYKWYRLMSQLSGRRCLMVLGVSSFALLTACTSGTEVTLNHLHGLGYSADGKELYIPAHEGILVYSDGKWRVPDWPKHDYMGYSQTDTGFYSSGHPAPGSSLPNPLGLVKSADGGRTITSLAFQGAIDFHSMSAGYKNHALYVFNPASAGQLGAGLHYSLDDGDRWNKSALQGVLSPPIQVAVHPTNAAMVALATEQGLFLSTDYGNRFERVGEQALVTVASFSPVGDQLVFGFQTLYAYDLAAKQVRPLRTPSVAAKDAIGYVALNPVQPQELVMGTFSADLYRSVDGGQTWSQIVAKGKGRPDRPAL